MAIVIFVVDRLLTALEVFVLWKIFTRVQQEVVEAREEAERQCTWNQIDMARWETMEHYRQTGEKHMAEGNEGE